MTRSMTATLTVNPFTKKPSQINCVLDPTGITLGKTVTVKGHLRDLDTGEGLVGKTVDIWAKWEKGAWFKVVSVITESARPGYWEHISKPSEEGMWEYYSEFLGDEEYEGCPEGEGNEDIMDIVGKFEWG